MYGLLPLHCLETGLLGKKMCKCGKKCLSSECRVVSRWEKKKKMSFCHPVVSLLFPFPDPFKLLCKKCSLIGVRACVLPRPRECLCAGASTRGWRPPVESGGALVHLPGSRPPKKPAHAPCF